MPELAREDAAAALLRALPAGLADRILARLSPAAAERLRARLQAAAAASPEHLDRALAELASAQPPGDRPAPPADADPVQALRALSPDELLRGLRGEPPPAIAAALACLEATAAATLLPRLPPTDRPEVALRLSRPAPADRGLRERLARAVLAKSRAAADTPPEPTADDRDRRTAALLRALGREERLAVLKRLEQTDAAGAARVSDQLYQFDDLLRLEDRALQGVLAAVDQKTLAIALTGAPEPIAAKVLANVSSRARAALEEEAGLLGRVSKAKADAARADVVAVLRKFEDEGKLTLGE